MARLTTTYGVHSLENLDGPQNEVINSYRLAKDANTPCGFFFQAPTSGVLTVGLSETQLREGSDGESASLCRPAVQASAGETRMTDQLTRRAEKLADCELLSEKNQTSAPAAGLAISSHSNARSVCKFFQLRQRGLLLSLPGCIYFSPRGRWRDALINERPTSLKKIDTWRGAT
nr:unnamed protein product [Spirometra erinaceieuropaei]